VFLDSEALIANGAIFTRQAKLKEFITSSQTKSCIEINQPVIVISTTKGYLRISCGPRKIGDHRP